MAFKTPESKVYKLHLISRYRPLFGDFENSENWEPFIKVLDDDVTKQKELELYHPRNKDKRFFRKYVNPPANGNAFMMVGQQRRELDSAGVNIVLRSDNHKQAYIVVFDYKRSFRNPDLLVEMVVNAINRALPDSDIEIGFTPWDIDDKDSKWCADYMVSYCTQYKNTKGKNIPNYGFEDMLEQHRNKKTKKEKRKLQDDLQLNLNLFVMQNADVSVNSAGNNIARTIINKLIE